MATFTGFYSALWQMNGPEEPVTLQDTCTHTGTPGVYLTLYICGDRLISWSSYREHGCPAAFQSREIWGHAPSGNFGVLGHTRYSGAFWGVHSLLSRGSSDCSSLSSSFTKILELETISIGPCPRWHAYWKKFHAWVAGSGLWDWQTVTDSKPAIIQ